MRFTNITIAAAGLLAVGSSALPHSLGAEDRPVTADSIRDAVRLTPREREDIETFAYPKYIHHIPRPPPKTNHHRSPTATPSNQNTPAKREKNGDPFWDEPAQNLGEVFESAREVINDGSGLVGNQIIESSDTPGEKFIKTLKGVFNWQDALDNSPW